MSASYLHFQCAVFSINYFKTTTQEKLKTIFKVLNHKISKQLSRIILLHVKIFRFFPPNILKSIIVLFYVSVFEYKLSKGFSLFLPIHNPYCGPILPPRIMFKTNLDFPRMCPHKLQIFGQIDLKKIFKDFSLNIFMFTFDPHVVAPS